MSLEQGTYTYQKRSPEIPTLPPTNELKQFGKIVERLPFGVSELFTGLIAGEYVMGIAEGSSLQTKIPLTIPVQRKNEVTEQTLEIDLGYVNRFFTSLSTRSDTIAPQTLLKVFGYMDVALQHQLIAKKITNPHGPSHFEQVPMNTYQLPFKPTNLVEYLHTALGEHASLLPKRLPDVPYDYSLYLPFFYKTLREEGRSIDSYIQSNEGQIALARQFHTFRRNPSVASLSKVFGIRHIPTQWRYMNAPYETLNLLIAQVIPDMYRHPEKYQGKKGYINTAKSLGNMHLGQLWSLLSSVDAELLQSVNWGDKMEVPYSKLQEFEDVYLPQLQKEPQLSSGLHGYLQLAKSLDGLHLGHLWGLVKSYLTPEQFKHLDWRYINLPFAKVEETRDVVLRNIQKNPTEYTGISGMIRTAHEAGNMHLGYLWALVDAWDPSLRETLQWEYIPVTFENLQASLDYNLLKQDKYKGPTGCLKYMQDASVPIPLHLLLKVVSSLGMSDTLGWPEVKTRKKHPTAPYTAQILEEEEIVEILNTTDVQNIVHYLSYKYALIGNLVGYGADDLEAIAALEIVNKLKKGTAYPSHYLHGIARHAMRKAIVTERSKSMGVTTDTISLFYTNQRLLEKMLGREPTEKELSLATHLPLETIYLLNTYQNPLSVDYILGQTEGMTQMKNGGQRRGRSKVDTTLQTDLPDTLFDESELSDPTQSVLRDIFPSTIERRVFILYVQDTDVDEISQTLGIPPLECHALVANLEHKLTSWQQAHSAA